MKYIIILLLLSFPLIVFSQNVGIGTTAPLEKLEVKNALRSTLRISSNSFNDTTELLLSNRNSGNNGTDFSIKSVREEGLIFSSLSDVGGNNSSNSLVIRPGGNVGIGLIPAYKFQVSGQSRFNGLTQIEGLNLFEFGAGIASKEISAGKIGYNAFGQNALTFVGAGTNATNRAVYFFAEGGTTMNGPLDIAGPLKVNGNPGIIGQVLTSNGITAPTWQNAAFGNNIRFAASFAQNLSLANGNARFTSTRYNLSPTDIVFGSNQITFNKSGLYHFDVHVSAIYSFSSTPPSAPLFDLWLYIGLASPFQLLESEQMRGSTTQYSISGSESIELYIQAPATVSLYHSFGLGGGSVVLLNGFIAGHLISE